MPDILNIGTSALTALQRAISTTGHNIANVNTEGYSRQEVSFVTRTPEYSGAGAIGTGTTIGSIDRAYNSFLTADVQNRQSSATFYERFSQTASRVDELLADPSTGISPALDDFFASIQAVSTSPTTLPERQVMLSEAETLVQRFDYLDSRLGEFVEESNARIGGAVADINRLGTTVAQLNRDIAEITARSGGNTPNDLLDLRDQAVDELSRLVKTSTQTQEDGSLNIFIGRGQPLVVGTRSEQLTASVDPLNTDQLNVFMSSGNNLSGDVTDFLTGGELGAALAAADGVIGSIRQDLGYLATAISRSFNEAQLAGEDLNGNPGAQMFADLQPITTASASNTGTAAITAAIPDLAAITGDSYLVKYEPSGLTVTNTSTGDITSVTGPSFVVEGVEFTVTGTGDQGDSFLIEPTAQGARRMTLLLDEPEQVAAALPGGGVGDNRNVLAMLDIQDATSLKGGATIYDFYASAVTDVAVATRRSSSIAATEQSLLRSAQERKGSLVGVNLEEEAANLIRYQQAYQAAAQVIATANLTFDELIAATRR
jgi:flagellar hook-associated protein 1 FlgK